MIINIQDDVLKLHALGLLDGMLLDKTTKQHIMWATGAYASLGERYEYNGEITPDLITGEHASVIKTRARKAMEQQSARTRQHAEVFTPLWMCQMMNDYADEVWFGAKEVFFKDGTPTAAVEFPKGKRWERYVDSRRLEITCGEAPYLVSRYDVETGEAIPIRERVGLLDRKLRVVGENTQTEAEWLEWAARAFWATYGYEFQGDNVLIARVNLLMTFEEYLQERWKRKPTRAEYEKIANIITWNIWQMDGLTGTVPYGTPEEQFQQIDWFGMFGEREDKEKQPRCLVHNWTGGGSVEFLSLPVKGKKAMKFDFIIGNPPYQDETIGENKTFAPPIYHLFLDGTYKISDHVELIHPARFLFNAGSTPKEWNKKMLDDPHLKVLYYEPNSSKVFVNTDIKGGIAITYHDATQEFGAIKHFVVFEELKSIANKVEKISAESLTSIIYASESYRFTEQMHKEHPEAEVLLSKGHKYDFKTSVLENLNNIVFFSQKPDDGEYIQILGLVKAKRIYKWIKKQYIQAPDNLLAYKVFVPAANGSGALGEVLSTPLIGEPLIGHTQTFISIGCFQTKREAENLLKYIKSKFCRVMLGILKITQHNPGPKWQYVPLQDFTPNSDIDWSQSISEIDQQLYKKYGLDEQEIQFIESHVKEMA
ncbi:Eco57I restriction-modification methylase domain-containing protein [uncultured Oscillibacter sp.]|uniref:Eco57I restriction-modification methylase domain-containing protein n=1 Tax=uncultured Oscillibacter sp. TaxID=876091 RepID=UPI0028044475|nr:Eco57I restriction-modification methylase domain-containing protein [uncultured Oscillibacter sp.]